jgi:hypothetical protein
VGEEATVAFGSHTKTILTPAQVLQLDVRQITALSSLPSRAPASVAVHVELVLLEGHPRSTKDREDRHLLRAWVLADAQEPGVVGLG